MWHIPGLAQMTKTLTCAININLNVLTLEHIKHIKHTAYNTGNAINITVVQTASNNFVSPWKPEDL